MPVEPPRSRIAGWFENAKEGIEIMTVHPCSPSRQGMNELGVGVINDVKEIECLGHPLCMPGKSDEAVEESIDVERGGSISHHGQASEELAERRTYLSSHRQI
ncbi:MAG: hypothetical protein MUF18_15390 [Fimbriiglobus sp.]|nr:hypothetical protein [Fimbriiglobus sp.]